MVGRFVEQHVRLVKQAHGEWRAVAPPTGELSDWLGPPEAVEAEPGQCGASRRRAVESRSCLALSPAMTIPEGGTFVRSMSITTRDDELA